MVRGGTISHTPRWLVAAYRHRISDSPPEDGTGLPAHLAVARPEGHGQAKGILPAHRDMPEAGGVSVPVVEMDALALAAGMQQGVCVAVDLRPSSAWEGGHIPGAIPLRDAGLFRWLPDLFARYAMQRRLAACCGVMPAVCSCSAVRRLRPAPMRDGAVFPRTVLPPAGAALWRSAAPSRRARWARRAVPVWRIDGLGRRCCSGPAMWRCSAVAWPHGVQRGCRCCMDAPRGTCEGGAPGQGESCDGDAWRRRRS